MKRLVLTLGCLCFLATQAQADIIEEINASQNTKDQACVDCGDKKQIPWTSEEFDKAFHTALEKNRPLFSECLRRSGRTFPKDMLQAIIDGKITLGNSKKLELYDALQQLSNENITKTASCILALTHTLSDETARVLGITVPATDHLARFDSTEAKARSEMPH